MINETESSLPVRARALVATAECPMARAAEVLGDRWLLLILREAFYGVVRYDDMRLDLGVSRSTLTNKLNQLVLHGILERRPYQEGGARARDAYVLTDSGRGLAMTLRALSEWGEEHLLDGPSPVDLIDRRTRRRLHLELVDEEGRAVPLSEAALTRRAEDQASPG